jgi:hypothetical protein
MIIVRDVFQAKYGRGDELVALFKELEEPLQTAGMGEITIMTDLSGRFFTVVTEEQVESLEAYEKSRDQLFADPKFEGWFARMTEVVEAGSREFYNLVD